MTKSAATTCDDGIAQVYVEGGLTEAEAVLYEIHLAKCARCRRAVASYKQLFWDLRHPGYKAEPVPAEMQRVSDNLMNRWEEAQAEASVRGEAAAPAVAPVPALAGLWAAAQGLQFIPGVGPAGRLAAGVARRAPRALMSAASLVVRQVRKGRREAGVNR